MPNYRRNRLPGGTYFFTVNLLDRKSQLLVLHINELRAAVRKTRQLQPFHIDAWIVLPDHLCHKSVMSIVRTTPSFMKLSF